MSFYHNFGKIRAWGREIVLPTKRIKEELTEGVFGQYCTGSVIDFGAGTLYWSNWFSQIVGEDHVYPVDIIYKEKPPQNSLHCFTAIDDIPFENIRGPVCFFACDVLHHLSEELWERISKSVFNNCEIIVLKDINCNYKFKNWMNRMHDRIINGEKIRDIDPNLLLRKLESQGYQCTFYNNQKLWFPHFLIVAVRKDIPKHAGT